MNGQIYIKDPTIKQVVYKNSLPETISYLEEMCQRGLNKSRKQLMNEAVELGHAYDDVGGYEFLRYMQEQVEIGMVKNGKNVKCDITMNLYDKPEYGT